MARGTVNEHRSSQSLAQQGLRPYMSFFVRMCTKCGATVLLCVIIAGSTPVQAALQTQISKQIKSII